MPYRFVLCELLTPSPGSADSTQAIKNGILASPHERLERVRRVMESPIAEAADLLLFPGWTLVGASPPKWVIAASKGRTVVLEMLPDQGQGNAKKVRWARTYVLRDGSVIRGGIEQLLSSSDEAWEQGTATTEAHQVALETRTTRRWKLGGGRTATFMICGEINAVLKHGKSFPTPGGAQLPGADLVVNPSHTRMGPQAARDKRAFLARDGLVLCTANIYSGSAILNASRVGAEVYWKKKQLLTGTASSATSKDGRVSVERIWLGDDTQLVCGRVEWP